MNTATNAIAPTNTVDFYENLVALPSCGTLLARMRTVFSNWSQAAVESQAEPRWWVQAQAGSDNLQVPAQTRYFR